MKNEQTYKMVYMVVGEYEVKKRKSYSFFDVWFSHLLGSDSKEYEDMDLALFSTRAKAEKHISEDNMPWPDELGGCHIQEYKADDCSIQKWKVDYWE